MTDLDDASLPTPEAPYAPPSAGSALRGVRESAGLTIDDVAQQLKLAPRQVQALEDDDYARLPGRTFVRGFVRNYARFLQLDPDEVVALLPGADVAPALERPSIVGSGRPMGELPAEAQPRRSLARWAIPLLLVAVVIAAGVYEFRRQQAEREAAALQAPAPAVVPGGGASSGGAGKALPNPLTGGGEAATSGTAASSAPASANGATAADGNGAPPAGAAANGATSPSAGAATGGAASPAGAANSPGSDAGAGDATPARSSAPVPGAGAAASPGNANAPATAAGPGGASAAGESQLVFRFRGKSWVQVKDRNGNLLIAANSQPNSTETVSGAAPLDVVIGNAREVSATFRGQPVDLSPFVRGNVARLLLK